MGSRFSLSKRNLIVCRWLLLFAVLFNINFITYAEEACKFEYLGLPHDLIDSTIVLHEKVVAMSEYVHVGNPFNIITEGGACSIMFIIDVSASNTGLESGTDHDGIRFDVLRDVLDSIYN